MPGPPGAQLDGLLPASPGPLSPPESLPPPEDVEPPEDDAELPEEDVVPSEPPPSDPPLLPEPPPPSALLGPPSSGRTQRSERQTSPGLQPPPIVQAQRSAPTAQLDGGALEPPLHAAIHNPTKIEESPTPRAIRMDLRT